MRRLTAGREMRRTLAAFLLVLASGPATAQFHEDRLIPVDPELAIFETPQTYFRAARNHLLGNRPLGASVVVFPSFRKEWAIQVAYDRGEPFLMYAVVDTSLWGTLQEQADNKHLSEAEVLRTLRVPVSRHATPLSRATAGAVETAWTTMLEAARIPAEPRRILDGTSYLFFFRTNNGEGPRVGLTRSPEAGTPAAAIAALAEALRRHSEAPERDRIRSEAE